VSETVYIPPGHQQRRRPGVFVPPLLIFPLIAYNIIAFVFFAGSGEAWNVVRFTVPMVSGEAWGVTASDLMIVAGLAFLFLEIVKSTQTGRSSVLEHMLSTLVFVVFLVEFLLVGAAATSVFFILMVMSLVDVIAGFTVSITSAGRDVTMG